MTDPATRKQKLRRRRFWARVRHGCLMCVELLAGLALVAALAGGAFFWRLSSGDISISFLTRPIEQGINAQLAGYHVLIEDTVLEKTGAGGGIGVSVRLKGLALQDAAGRPVAKAPKAAVGISLAGLLTGQLIPSRIELIGARLALTYGPNGQVSVTLEEPSAVARRRVEQGAAEPAGAGDQGPNIPSADATAGLLQALLGDGAGGAFAGLREIGIRDTTAVFIHQRLDRRWEISHGTVLLTRESGREVRLHAEANVVHGGEFATVSTEATLRREGEEIIVAGQINDLIPRLLGQGFESLDSLTALDLPVTAKFSAGLLDDGKLQYAELVAAFGAGFLRPPGAKDGILVDEGNLHLSYDAKARLLKIEPSQFFSGRTRIALQGRAQGGELNGADRDLWRYSISSHDLLLGSANVSEEPVPVDRVELSGSYDAGSGSLVLDMGRLVAGASNVSVAGQLVPAGDASPRIAISGTVSPMPVKALKAIWPRFAASGAREWVAENVISGQLDGGTFKVDFAPGVIDRLDQGEPIPDEALRMDFSFRDVRSSYLSPMPHIRGADGRGAIIGDSFVLTVPKAYLVLPSGSRLALADGSVEIPNISAKVSIGKISAGVSGDVPDLIELLNHEPLGYPRDLGIGRDKFSGSGQVALKLELPLVNGVQLADVDVKAEAEVNDLAGKNAFDGRDVKDGVLLFGVADNVLTAGGEVLLDGIPATLVWHLPFKATASNKPSFVARMQLDEAGRRKMGLDLDFVSGPVRFEFEPKGGFGKKAGSGKSGTRVAADLKLASVNYPSIGWEKPPGVPGDLSFDVTTAPDGGTVLDNLALDSDGAKIRGRVVLDRSGKIESIRFPTFQLHANDDLSLTADRTGANRMRIAIKGPAFDASELIRMELRQGQGKGVAKNTGGGDRLGISANIDRVTGRDGARLNQVKLNLSMDQERVSEMNLSGLLEGGAELRATVQQTGAAGMRLFRLDASDAGAAFRFAGFYSRAEGGNLALTAQMPADPNSPAPGQLRASDFRIRGEPILSTISAAAVTQGNFESKSGDVVSFDRLRMRFERRPGLFRLKESVLRSPSIGATLEGDIDFANNRVDMSGTYIPAYAINNLLSHVPVLGKLLIGKDEGLVGINYAVSGPTENLSVTVNPISAVAPGILRKIFDVGSSPSRSRYEPSSTADQTGSIPQRARNRIGPVEVH